MIVASIGSIVAKSLAVYREERIVAVGKIPVAVSVRVMAKGMAILTPGIVLYQRLKVAALTTEGAVSSGLYTGLLSTLKVGSTIPVRSPSIGPSNSWPSGRKSLTTPVRVTLAAVATDPIIRKAAQIADTKAIAFIFSFLEKCFSFCSTTPRVHSSPFLNNLSMVKLRPGSRVGFEFSDVFALADAGPEGMGPPLLRGRFLTARREPSDDLPSPIPIGCRQVTAN